MPSVSLPLKSRLEAAKHPPAATAEQALLPLPPRFSRPRSRPQQRSAAIPAARIALGLITLPESAPLSRKTGGGKNSLGLQRLTALRETGSIYSRH